MIEYLYNRVSNKTKEYIIIDVGSQNCLKSIEFYNMFPNSKIYILDFNPDKLAICKQNIELYTDRITIIYDNVFNPDEIIDICYINENNFTYLQNKISLNHVKLLINNDGILFDNMKSNIEMFCVYHKNYFFRKDNFYFTFFGVNEVYPKNKTKNNILEYELTKYNPFLQKRGYMETSAYLHVFWNKLYTNKEMIGFSQYDMQHIDTYDNLDKNSIYLLNSGCTIVNNGQWNNLMCSKLRNLQFLIDSYNKHFNKKYSINELENMPLSLWQTNIYPVQIYKKLCNWLEKLVYEIYPWSNQQPYEMHFGSIGGYTERALSIFNSFEIYEGISYKNLNINSNVGYGIKEQYNKKSFLNNYCQDICTKYIDNITGGYNVNFCMFKAECYLDNIKYNCERICKNGKNGLYFTRSDWINYIECGFNIEAEDPRIFIFNNIVYVIFICLSPYNGQKRCIGFTTFNEWKPIFLQIENMQKNVIEKNWAPFTKENNLYFVYNYDPLIIINYDLNEQGICSVIYKQDNIKLPINTANTFLRGGSNLIHYKDDYYIGGCHSRIYKKCYEHYTHIILLNTNNWELSYVSKPIMYNYAITEKLNAWHQNYKPMSKELDKMYNILNDKTPNIIQDPISLYKNNDNYYITINVRDCVTLLYEMCLENLTDFVKTKQDIGFYENCVRNWSFQMT